jgi:hypothetical protein
MGVLLWLSEKKDREAFLQGWVGVHTEYPTSLHDLTMQ